MDTYRRAVLLGAAGMLPGLAAGLAFAAPGDITYPRVDAFAGHVFDYYWRLLDEILVRTAAEFGEARALPSSMPMNHERAMLELAAGSIQVYRRGLLPPDFADRLSLVSVPLDRGLLGYRAFLTRRSLQDRLSQVVQLEDLKGFRFGQLAGWSDVGILRNAGLEVVTTVAYEGLYGMLQRNRFDILPMAISEVVGEHDKHAATDPELVIEGSLLMAYKLSFFYIVKKSPEGQRLKERLLLGLQRMRADGSFDALYKARKTAALKGLNLKGRRVIRIENPNYRDPMYMQGDAQLWDTLATELAR